MTALLKSAKRIGTVSRSAAFTGAFSTFAGCLLFLFCSTASVAADDSSDKIIKFSNTTIDLGAVDSLSPPVDSNFIFRNTSNGPITISNVRTGCGCAPATFDKRTFEGGEQGAISIHFDPKGRRGKFQINAYVFVSGHELPCASLTLKAVVSDPVSLEPEAIDLGRADLHAAARREISVRNNTRKQVEISEIKSVGAQFRVTASTLQIAPGQSAKLSVLISPDLDPGRLEAAILLRTSASEATLSIPVIGWHLQSPVYPSQQCVALGFLKPSSHTERAFLLQSDNNREFIVKNVTIHPSLFSIEKPAGRHKTQRVVVSNSPQAQNERGLIIGKATFELDFGPETAVCTVDLSAFVDNIALSAGRDQP